MWLSVTLVKEAIDYQVRLSTLTVSFFASVAVFALVYVVCLRFNVSISTQYALVLVFTRATLC